MNRRTFAKTLIAVSVLGSTMLGTVGNALAAPPTINFGGSTWISNYPVWIAIERGIFKSLGIDVKWNAFGTGSARMSALLSGSIDVSSNSSISTISLIAAGSKDFQLIGSTDSFATLEGVFGKKPITTIGALKGKKIGVTYASSGHILILDLLKQYKLDPNKDVQLINMPVSDIASSLKSGQVDAGVAWTPVFEALRADPANQLIATDENFTLYKQFHVGTGPNVLMVTNSFAKANPDAVKAFVKGCGMAVQMLKQNPKEAAQVVAPLTKLPVDVQESVIKATDWHTLDEQKKIMTGDQSFQKGLNQLAAFMREVKMVPNVPDIGALFNTSYLSQ
ncbi:ABC transporter substrate-binding protein [Burkholderia anthina]|uniref:ABC transporter substrate-binding protein n=1 Tax=Burkholderia anthina TaxID=179879 RepID=UPI001AA0658D|nr:ABC transporter substrate-binding protein [Burkholderia anthina]QTD94932.1 ABC transporter substrate-binding protein [Burkholderia anthina]